MKVICSDFIEEKLLIYPKGLFTNDVKAREGKGRLLKKTDLDEVQSLD